MGGGYRRVQARDRPPGWVAKFLNVCKDEALDELRRDCGCQSRH